MIIHKPKISSSGNRLRISSYIEVETKAQYSDTLWYEFDIRYKKNISKNMDGFVSAMIMLAMNLGEDIQVDGYISPKLSYGLHQLQGYFTYWYPGMFQQIKITPKGYREVKQTTKGAMCTFSGGVDAFYTLQKHLPENEPNPSAQMTHCLLIDGFALPRNKKMNESYAIIKESYTQLIRDLGLELVFVKTNVANFYHKRIVPSLLDGPMLSVIPQLLNGLVSNFYIASCLSYGQMLPRGSNAITNTMLSTEGLNVMIDGSDKSRAEKIHRIAKWRAIYKHLRVCWDDFGVQNCCECEKCIRTMIVLEAAGVLSKCKTFPKPLTRKKVRNWKLTEIYHFWFAQENLEYAKKRGRHDLVIDIKYAMLKGKIHSHKDHYLKYVYRISAKLKQKSNIYATAIKVLKGT